MVIYCADIGSIQGKKFGWARLSPTSDGQEESKEQGTCIEALAGRVAEDLRKGRRVALGFECPLWVPVARNCDPDSLTKGRCGDKNRPWSAAAGATSLATGLTEVTWVLNRVRECLGNTSTEVKPFLCWECFWQEERGLFLWEAMVTGKAKATEQVGKLTLHQQDAWTAVCAFAEAGRELATDVHPSERTLSLIGAALLWSDWSENVNLLREPCVVVRPERKCSQEGAG